MKEMAPSDWSDVGILSVNTFSVLTKYSYTLIPLNQISPQHNHTENRAVLGHDLCHLSFSSHKFHQNNNKNYALE